MVLNVKKCLKKLVLAIPLSDSLRSKLNVYRYVDRILLSSSEVKMAEENPKIISELLGKKEKELPALYQKLENQIVDLLNVAGTEDFENEKKDMLFCYFAYGFTPNEYLCYGFKERKKERKGFVSDRESVKLAYKLNKFSTLEMFKDKMKTYNVLKEFYKRNLIAIRGEEDYDAYLEFVFEHPMFVKKNDKEACGRGVELIRAYTSEKENRDLFEKLLDEIKKTGEKIILEELVCQSEVMAKFNSSSVNTVRCTTLKTKDGVVAAFYFMRVGRNGAFVDNGGAGGLFIGIDEENGVLNSDAMDEFGVKYEKHPDSGETFRGYELPEWGKMTALCKEMAEQMKEAKWIGWDMAHTDKGWVVIEANGATEVIGPQATSGIGIRERLEEYLKNTKVLF